MADVIKSVVREPAAKSAESYGRRVNALALIYVLLFTSSLIGMAIIVWKGQFFVTLAQRSNVETLVLAFFFIFFAYIALISRSGALGGLQILFFSAILPLFKDPQAVEEAKARALTGGPGEGLEVALNVLLERVNQPGTPFDIPLADAAGPVGVLQIDGARIVFEPAFPHSSNNVFSYFEQQLHQVLEKRGMKREVNIVKWKAINDEETEAWISMTEFASNLERFLGADELWPKIRLTKEDVAELESRLSDICHALRNESFLPDWEYSAEHKLPIIPEPLGLASLSRTENRADPLATMGLALMIVLGSVAVMTLIVVFPPWVPGK